MIKLLACVLMLIDHVGLVFFPDKVILRLIGRLSFPLFAFSLANGFYFTMNQNGKFAAYFRRMVVFAIISQLPYMLMVGRVSGNIGVLWCLSLLFLHSLVKTKKSPSAYFTMAAIIIVTVIIPMDYGIYGLMVVVAFYCFAVKADRGGALWVSFAAATIVRTALFGFSSGAMQLFALPCVPMIDMLKKQGRPIRTHKYLFYAFYPLHLLALVAVKWLVSR